MRKELLKRIEAQVQRQGSMGAIALAEVLNEVVDTLCPVMMGDGVLSHAGTMSEAEFAEVFGNEFNRFVDKMSRKDIFSLTIKGENLMINTCALSVEDNVFYCEYRHGVDHKSVTITHNEGDNTYTVAVADVQ